LIKGVARAVLSRDRRHILGVGRGQLFVAVGLDELDTDGSLTSLLSCLVTASARSWQCGVIREPEVRIFPGC
jgi:hypothetical protein